MKWFFVLLFSSNSYGKQCGKQNEHLFSIFKTENGGSKAGVPFETPKGSRWGVPLLETPHFPARKYKIMQILVFLLVFHNVTGEQLNRVLFLIFSYEASNDSSVEELSSFTQESRVQFLAEAGLFLLLFISFTLCSFYLY